MDKDLLNYFSGDELAASTWQNKYALKDNDGNFIEKSPVEMHKRLAKEFWRVEKEYISNSNTLDKSLLSEYGQKRANLTEDKIFELFDHFKYIVPAGSVMSGAGSGQPVSLSNCFVLPTMPEDSYSSIMKSRDEMVQLEKRRGGTGLDLSKLRPAGAFVNNAAKTSTGAASFMEGFSAINNEVAQCIEENQEVLTRRGLVRIKDINIGDEVFTRKGFIKVINKFDKGVKDIILLKTKFGTELRATSDHIIMSATHESGPINKKISDLIPNDPIAILGGTNEINNYQILNYSYQKPLSRTLKDGSMIPHNRYEDITIPTILDEKLAYLVGYAHGDGYTETKCKGNNKTLNLTVAVCNKDKDIMSKISLYRKDIFGNAPRSRSGDGNCTRITICSTEGCKLLEENGLNKPKTEFLSVPNIIWESPSSVQMAYFSGLFDADGYASGKKKGYSLCTINRNFALNIRKLLILNGIFAKLYTEIPKNKNWHTKYYINVVGTYNQTKLIEKATECLKIQNLKFISKRDSIITPFIVGIEGITKKPHIEYKHLISAASLARTLYDDQMMFLDYVSEIIPSGQGHVYDIELESENMFWCEGIYVHNCGRRGALMLTISILHPDSPEFIEKKQDLTKVTGANVSVKIPDSFMEAVEKDEDFVLRWPISTPIDASAIPELESAEYGKLYKAKFASYIIRSGESAKITPVYFKKIRAKELWNKLIHCAWNTAEPGILFESQLHNWAPDGVYPEFRAVSTNPCVTGDTLVDGLGFKRSVKDLLDKGDWAGLKVKSYNLTSGKVEYKELLNIQLTKRKAEVLALKISSDGVNFHIIKLTPDHKVYTVTRNYVEAKDLTKDDVFYVEDTKKAMLYEKVKLSVLEDVYDLTVKDNHNFYANEVLIKNCGEIPMEAGNSCRLIHCNLTSFIDNPYLENAAVDYDRAYKTFYEATRLGDDLVSLEIEAVNRILGIIKEADSEKKVWEKILNTAKRSRRAGVGFFGLSDLIASLGVKFCSPESIEITDHLCKVMMKAELDAEIDMAIERGCFPGYNKNTEVPGANDWYKFIEETYPEQWERMQKYGRRNVSFSTIAPTGSVAMVARASSGIEPVFMPFYTRRRKCNSDDEHYDFVDKLGIKFQEFVVVHPGLEDWAKTKYPDEDIKNWKLEQWEKAYEESPWKGSTSPEIDWEKRVELQGVVQKYITHAISSTVNLPNSVTEEEVSKIYLTAWKTGNKGQTVYRDGCRDGVLISVNEKKKDEKFRSYVEAPKRPKVLEADFHTTRVKGEVFYVMVGLYLDKPYEVFVYKPELGEGEKPPKQHRGEIIKIKKGVYTFKSDTLTIENISKDLSPLEYTVVLFSSMLLRTGANLKYVLKTAQKAKDGINGFVSALVRILSKYSPEELLKGEICPECGNDLTREGGCIICKNCGYSVCL